MNETLQNWLTKAREYVAGLSAQKKILIGVIGLLIAAAGSVVMIVANQDPYQLLYADLHAEDSRAITKKLGEQGIPYKVTEDQTTITVPSSRVASARMELAKAGLPGQEVVGFEKFDGSTLGMSTYVQRIQYLRAVQGELTRSIERLSSVKRARVHISVPPKKTFLEEEDPPKASVVLELKSGQKPSKQEVNGIAHLVASAVEGLKVHEVTIVDNSGNFLHRPDDGSAQGLSSTLLEMQRSIENDYEKRIEDILTPIVGLDKIRAKVTAEIDPSRTNTTEETYDPEKAVARTTMKNNEVTQGSRPNPIGIPGSRSNLPGTEVTNPGIPMANSTSEKNLQNTNFAIPKKTQTTDKPSGNIKRLTVAVVVDGYYNKGAQPGETFAPRSDEELKRLQELVANAVGYDAQRRDSITVSSLPFKVTDLTPADEVAPTALNTQELMRNGLKNGLIAMVILLFFFMVVRPFLRWATLGETEKEINLMPRTVAELQASRRDEGLLALSKAASAFDETEPLDKKEETELKEKIMERLGTTPRKGFRIVQDWLDEDNHLLKLEAA
jgi:flagellar M-ring protein FliF